MSRARAERRREQKLQQKAEQETQQALARICATDKGAQFALDRAYQQGYNQARKELTTFIVSQVLSAIALAARRKMRFGMGRNNRLLDWVREILLEEMPAGNLVEKCKQETGIEIIMK